MTPPALEFASPPLSFSETLEATDDAEHEHWFRTIQNVLDMGAATKPDEELHFLAVEL